MIYKVFDIKGTKGQQDLIVGAINKCTFPFELCSKSLNEKWAQTHVPVTWINDMDNSTLGRVVHRRNTSTGQVLKGSLKMELNAKYFEYFGTDPYFLPPYPKKLGEVVDLNEDGIPDDGGSGTTWQGNAYQPELMRKVFIHEAAHVVDHTYMTGTMRKRIYNAWHPPHDFDVAPHGHAAYFKDPERLEEDRTARLDDDVMVPPPFVNSNGELIPSHRIDYALPGAPIPGVPGREEGFHRTVINDYNDQRSWMQPEMYQYRVGESFAECFVKVYTDLQDSSVYKYNSLQYFHRAWALDAQWIIARTLTPWMLELYPQDQASGGTGGQQGGTVEGLPPYIPPATNGGGSGEGLIIPGPHSAPWPLPAEPLPPTDPVGWRPVPGTGTINGFYATKKEKRFHNGHQNYAPEGAIIYPTREAAVESGKVPCPQCQP